MSLRSHGLGGFNDRIDHACDVAVVIVEWRTTESEKRFFFVAVAIDDKWVILD